MARPAWIAGSAAVVVVAAVAGVVVAQHVNRTGRAVVVATLPTVSVTAATAPGHGCRRTGMPTDLGTGDRVVRVDPHPTAVTIVWVAGLNPPCGTATTTGDAALATRLALDIDSAPKPPPGSYVCPSDDGSAALLGFHRAGTTDLQLVVVGLTGCGSVSAPHRAVRVATVIADLPANPLRAAAAPRGSAVG